MATVKLYQKFTPNNEKLPTIFRLKYTIDLRYKLYYNFRYTKKKKKTNSETLAIPIQPNYLLNCS